MSDEAAFLATICANPDDDGPRLVYADWLQEFHPEGQASIDRADFIRMQLEFEGWREICRCHSVDREKCPGCVLRRRERELFDADERRTLNWFGLPQLWAQIVRLEPFNEVPVSYPYAVARRGFLHALTCPWGAWHPEADVMLAQRQPVREVALMTMPDAEQQTIGRINAPPNWRPPTRIRRGKFWTWEELGSPSTFDAHLLALLAAEWGPKTPGGPGVTFTLPQVRRGRSAPITREMIAGAEIRAGDMVYLDEHGRAVTRPPRA